MKAIKVVLVDKKDNKIGLEEKTKAHLKQGKLHRAFMVFILNEKGEILLQRRSEKKCFGHYFGTHLVLLILLKKRIMLLLVKED
jgi:isopentenyldiphosphate isomerase